MNLKIIFLLMCLQFLTGCFSKPFGLFRDEKTPPTPHYSNDRNWAALPHRADVSDLVPLPDLASADTTREVDVFFLHPTTYTGKGGKYEWNASLDDQKINAHTDQVIKFQASIFNAAGRVYAPRFRQAHLRSFFTQKHSVEGEKALALAYEDVRAAFEYYLLHYNEGRPIILAGHSQGARHGIHLLREYFDGTSLQPQLVVAYLVGYPIRSGYYEHIEICKIPEQTGCFCSWRTFQTGYYPKGHVLGNSFQVVNPISWRATNEAALKSDHLGSVLRDFSKVRPNFVNARVHDGLLWVDKPTFRGSWLLRTKNFHPGDFNLFYLDVRQNAQHRVEQFLKK